MGWLPAPTPRAINAVDIGFIATSLFPDTVALETTFAVSKALCLCSEVISGLLLKTNPRTVSKFSFSSPFLELASASNIARIAMYCIFDIFTPPLFGPFSRFKKDCFVIPNRSPNCSAVHPNSFLNVSRLFCNSSISLSLFAIFFTSIITITHIFD